MGKTINETGKKKCHACGKTFQSDKLETIEGEHVCKKCIVENWTTCSSCSELTHKNDIVHFDGQVWCYDCRTDQLCSCEGCNEYVYRDDARYDGDCPYCEECYENIDRCDEEEGATIITIPFVKHTSASFKENSFKNFCGVEIEALNNNLYDNELSGSECEKYQFSQKGDGSLTLNGVEFSSNPANGDQLLKSIRAFCRLLNDRDYYVNTDCGLHIHIAISRQLSYLKKVFAFYRKYEELFFQMLPESRQNNSYCKKFSKVYSELKLSDVLKMTQHLNFAEKLYEVNGRRQVRRCRHNHGHTKRYGWVNFHSVLHRGTLEIRAHSGTINAQKIINWLKIHLVCLDFIKKLSVDTINRLPSDKAFFLSLFDTKLQYYIKTRWKKFNGSDYHIQETDLNTRSPTPHPDQQDQRTVPEVAS